MSNINDYQGMIPFDSHDYDISMTKSASLKDELSSWKLQAIIRAGEHRVNSELSAYQKKNNKISNEMERYQGYQEPTPPSQGGKNLSNLRKLQKNLEITFTPFSVIISVKSGAKKLVIQTIETKDMPDEMLNAWRSKNAAYFKTYMSAKMQYSIQTAEHRLIMDGIRNSVEFQNAYSKQASEVCEELDDEMPFFNILFFSEKYAQQDEDTFEKLCMMGYATEDKEYVVSPLDNNEVILAVSRETHQMPKIASLSFLKDSKVITPETIKNNAKVVFLTDRVVYVIKDVIITTILLEEMSTTDILHFKMKDKQYFVNKFARQAKLLEQRRAYYGMSKMEKKASAPIFTLNTIFTLDFIHPYLYKILLDKKLGKDWTSFDEFVIIKNIETMFNIEVIGNSALNKILSIAAINSKQSNLAFTSLHAFEKIVRSFNDLPIDFEQRETDSLDGRAIAFALDVMDMCINDDVYTKLGPDVCEYIISVLTSSDYYAFYPNLENGTESQLDFVSLINQALLKSVIRRDVDSILDKEREAEVEREDEVTQAGIIGSLDFIRSGAANSANEVTKQIINFCNGANIDLRFVNLIQMHVEKNLAIDTFLKEKQSNLQTFAKIFKI